MVMQGLLEHCCVCRALSAVWDALLLLQPLTFLSSNSITSFPGLWPPTMWCVPWPTTGSGLHETCAGALEGTGVLVFGAQIPHFELGAVQPEVWALGSLMAAKHALAGGACMPCMCANPAEMLFRACCSRMVRYMFASWPADLLRDHLHALPLETLRAPPSGLRMCQAQMDRHMHQHTQAYLSACFS